jgi:hypothetical protein
MSRPYLFLRELLADRSDRLWNAFRHAYRGGGRRARWTVRVAGLALAAVAVTQLVPTLADEATPPANETLLAPEAVTSDSVVVLSASGDTQLGADNSPVAGGSDTEITYATTETETVVEPPPIVLSNDQSISTRIASTVKVDPRSVTALLPSIAFAGNETLLLCIQGSGLRFDASSKGFADDRKAEDFIAEGDLTGLLRVSGSYEAVATFVNSENGLRVWSSNGAIAGKVLSLSVVALSGPSIDRDFCDQGRSQSVYFQALGLGMNTKKGGVRLN